MKTNMSGERARKHGIRMKNGKREMPVSIGAVPRCGNREAGNARRAGRRRADPALLRCKV